jgi:hypothetical protein
MTISPTPRITEFLWHPNGQLAKLTLVNADTGDQVTRWLFGTTLADSAVASNGLVRAKIYPESDDRPAPASDGPDGVYSRLEYQYNRQGQQTEPGSGCNCLTNTRSALGAQNSVRKAIQWPAFSNNPSSRQSGDGFQVQSTISTPTDT